MATHKEIGFEDVICGHLAAQSAGCVDVQRLGVKVKDYAIDVACIRLRAEPVQHILEHLLGRAQQGIAIAAATG